MARILSTVKLKAGMMEELKGKFGHHHFKYVHRKEVTDKDRNEADIFVTYGGDISQSDVKDFKNLKWLMVMSAGVDDLPLQELKDVQITNATGIHRIQMTEYTLGLILNHYKNFTQLKKDQEKHEWRKNAKTEEIYNKEVHILGTGSIGSRLAEVLNIFGLKTVGYNTDGRSIPPFHKNYAIDDLIKHIKSADILINILPSTQATRNLLTVNHFKHMKDDGIFINIGRGDVISDEVILETLKEEYISHMILDVFNEEPLPGDHPFYQLNNITITPHASSKTDQYLERAFQIFIDNLDAYDHNKDMINQVEHQKGY